MNSALFLEDTPRELGNFYSVSKFSNSGRYGEGAQRKKPQQRIAQRTPWPYFVTYTVCNNVTVNAIRLCYIIFIFYFLF